MVSINLINMKYDNSKSYQMFKPTKTKHNQYKITFDSKKSKEFIQFVLFVKFINSIKITQINTNNTYKYTNFPYNGIIYSFFLTETTPVEIEIEPLDLCSKIIIKKYLITPVNSIKLNPIVWDKIFVINLARRSDRKKQMENFFLSANIPVSNYEFITAFDGMDDTIKTQYELNIKSNPSNVIITSGHFACLLSHLKAINLAKTRGYKNIMILEDDVSTIETNLISKLNGIYVPNYDMLYLGGIMSKKKCFTTNWAYSGGTNIMGAYGYILSSKIFDKILNELSNLDEYIDFYYLKNIQRQPNTIILNDIIKTDLTTSDTSYKSRVMIKRLDMI